MPGAISVSSSSHLPPIDASCPVDAADGPAKVHPHVAAVGPTQLRKSLHEPGELGHCVRIVLSKWHQHSDTPHALLRARCDRPRRRRATEQRDDFASLHVLPQHEGTPYHIGMPLVQHSKIGRRMTTGAHARQKERRMPCQAPLVPLALDRDQP
jgi:hypothetical protein